MVTTALLRRKDFAPHSSRLELTVHEDSDITQVKATLTGRASVSLEEVKLDLSGLFHQNHRNKKLRKLFKALGDLPHLKTLRFHYNNPSSSLLERLPVQLLTIALSSQQGAGGRALEILELNHVNLTGTQEEFQRFYLALQNHPSLQVFSFSSSGCSSASSINPLLQALSQTPKLEKVVLYSEQGRSPWGRLSGDSIGALCRSRTLKDLQHLVLYDSTTATSNFFADEHTMALGQALSSSTTTTFSSSNGDNDNAQLLQRDSALANFNKNIIPTSIQSTHSFASSSRIEEIMISCWPLGHAGVEALCQMLCSNTSLRKVSMVIYELDEDNATQETCTLPHLATALQSNTTLQQLELHGRNEIGKWMEESFLELLMQSNFTLTHLKLFHDEALFLKPFLEFYLTLNRAGRALLLRTAAPTKAEWVDSLCRVRDDLSCLFYLLSMNPLLLLGQVNQ